MSNKKQPDLKYYVFGYVEGGKKWFMSGREWVSKPDSSFVN